MHTILFVGSLQSGKTTSAAAVMSYYLTQKGIIPNCTINEDGKVFIEYDKTNTLGIEFDIETQDKDLQKWMEKTIWPHIINVSFAEKLKQTAMELFGLEYTSVYGTNDQKNEKTHIKTKDMLRLIDMNSTKYKHLVDRVFSEEDDCLSGREFLQLFGSEIARGIYPDCHINSAIKKGEEYSPKIVIIPDGRFANEVNYIKDRGNCTIIKLKRSKFEATHSAEMAAPEIDDAEYDLVIDNNDMTMREKNKIILDFLIEKQILNTTGVKEQVHNVD